MTIRPATAADAPALLRIINEAYLVERFFVEGDRLSAATFDELLARGVFLVGEDASARPVACVYVEIRGERGHFGLLSVAPAHQGRGWGRRLVEEAESHARAAGCGAMDISVVNLRTELPPFYHRLGYRDTGTAPFNDPRALRPAHCRLMSKTLPGPALQERK